MINNGALVKITEEVAERELHIRYIPGNPERNLQQLPDARVVKRVMLARKMGPDGETAGLSEHVVDPARAGDVIGEYTGDTYIGDETKTKYNKEIQVCR